MNPKSLKAIVVDDEWGTIDLLMHHLSEFHAIRIVGTASNASDGFALIEKHKPDLAFLDIHLPDYTGLELAHKVIEIHPAIRIIFITAYSEHTIEAIRAQAFDYLLKPIDLEQLKEMFERLKKCIAPVSDKSKIKTLSSDKPIEHLRINLRSGFIKINPEEIIFIKASGNYTEIQLINNENHLVTKSIGALIQLLQCCHFLRISRSIAINLKYLRQVDTKKREILLKYGSTEYVVEASREYLKNLDQLF